VRKIIHLTGNIHRGSARLKHVLTALISGGTPDTNNDDYWSDDDEGIAWVAIGDMSTTALVRFTEKKVSESGLASKRLQVMPPGTLIYSMYASMGHVAELAIPATINQALLGFEFVEDVEPSFAKWWLRHLQPVLLAEASSNTQDNLNADKVKNLPFPAIDLATQVCIANYLDRETARIDRLIAEKERMLALLDEKRSALISRVVTRGLDANAPIKPSGLEWLGEIPAHWELRRIKFVSAWLDQGSSPIAANTPAAPGEFGVLKLSAVSKGRFKRDENKALRVIEDEEQPLALRKGDILITRGNTPELVADVAYVPEDEPSLLLPDLIYRLRIKEKEILAEYLTAFLTTAAARVQIRRDARGSSGSMVKVSQGHVMDWLTPLPPLFEQEEIMNLLRCADEGFQSVEREVSSSLTLLAERRAALITAAVTGKIPLEEMRK
jgi:type I restriction enzyme S subunit